MNKFYIRIAKVETFIISMIVAFGTFNLVALLLLLAFESIFDIYFNGFSLLCMFIAGLVIWFSSISKSFEITWRGCEDLFKINEDEE